MPQPIYLAPVYKNYIWGGDRLAALLGKHTAERPLAESWELCCHRDGVNTISGGRYDGLSLSRYLACNPGAVSLTREYDSFPLLVKYIDARAPLSIQVHPDADYARARENEARGKTELWYVLDCEEGASLLCGLKKEVSREELARAVADGSVEGLLRRVFVKPGDVIFVKAGTLHSIGAGVVVAEVQQSCNATYRVWDYGRLGADGRPRALHVDKALDVALLTPGEDAPDPSARREERGGYANTPLARCEYFDVRRCDVFDSAPLALRADSFTHLMAVRGGGELLVDGERRPLALGDSVFIPAGEGEARVEGGVSLILTCLG